MLSSRTLFGKKSGEDDDTNIMDFLGRGRVSGKSIGEGRGGLNHGNVAT